MATAQPAGQQRNAFGRDHGNYATVAAMPNGSGNVLPSASVPFTLEAGDTCYLSLSTGQCQYLCISAGTSGGGDAVWVPSSGQGPWSSVLYVDGVRGSDTTGQRGNENRPFQTIQAALNAMSTDDLVLVAPQLFTTTAAYTIPSAVVRGGCYGLDQVGVSIGASSPGAGTLLVNSTTNLWEFGANLGLSSFIIANMTLRASGHLVVNADGSLYAQNTFITNGLRLENIEVSSGSISTKYLRNMTLRYGTHSAVATYSFVNGSSVVFIGVRAASAAMTISWDSADPLSTTVPTRCSLTQSTQIGTSQVTTLGGCAQLIVDQTSTVGGLAGSALAVSGANVPAITCAGYIGGGGCDFATAGKELPDTATALTVDIRGARFYAVGVSQGISGATAVKFKVGGAAANFQTVKLDSTITLPACTITADAKVHITGRGADWPSVVLTTPGADGDIVPPMLTGIVDVSAGGAVAKTWVQLGYAGLIRTGAACDTAFLTASAQVADAVITAKATTGLTITSVISAGNTACNWLAIWK